MADQSFQNLCAHAAWFGLGPSDLHRIFMLHGDPFRMVGLEARDGKPMRIICERTTDRVQVRVKPETVKGALRK